MKIKNGFISNSSTTIFVLNGSTRDIDGLNRRLELFLQCGILCGFVDDLWDDKIRDMACYLENGVLHISGDSIPSDLSKLIHAIFDVKKEYQQ